MILKIGVACCVGLIVALVYAAILEAREWEVFRVDHKCRVVGRERGTTSTGFSTSGNVVTMTSADKTGWLCDDGVTYWR